MSLDYEREVREHIQSNFFKIALPIILPFYLLMSVLDWIWARDFILEFVLIRVFVLISMLILGGILKGKSSGYAHVGVVWAATFLFAAGKIVMALQIPNASAIFYLQSVNIIGGIMVFIFPMSLWRNFVTVFAAYLPALFILILHLRKDFSINYMFFYAIMMGILAAGASTVDSFRRKVFQQKISLYFMATTDSMSGLKVRRYFYSRFVQELVLRLRKDTNLVMSLIMMDIDHFKNVNDQFGHTAGDQCIRALGDVIRKHTRIYDVACRFGGEEFAVLLPETNMQEAMIVAERIRKAVQDLNIPFQKETLTMSISAGISGIQSPIAETLRQKHSGVQQKLFLVNHMMTMIREADAALYEAKAQKRNCVVLGKGVPLATDMDPADMETAQGHLSYFEQSVFPLQSREMPETADQEFEDFNFYTEEHFFRRCVEGLYRYYRTPQWKEVLAVVCLEHPNPEALRKHFHRLFRLSDTVAILGKGKYGVLFGNMTPEALSAVRNRIEKQLSNFTKSEAVRVRIAASPLTFEMDEKGILVKRDYYFFSKYVMEILGRLKNYRFQNHETLFVYSPPSTGVHKAAG